MPELPEAERIRQTLRKRIVGLRVECVTVRRRDMVHGCTTRQAMLQCDCVENILRKGKQLAIVGSTGAAVRVQLGMTGRLFVCSGKDPAAHAKHAHVRWHLSAESNHRGVNTACSSAANGLILVFEDARRFGALHTHTSLCELRKRWRLLGPDALTIRTNALTANLSKTRRAIKTALLDQRVLAGVGNIYADESLFTARIAPRRRANSLSADELKRLAAAIRRTLRAAISAGGSSIRDYVDGQGTPGRYQRQHQVYNRGGRPCTCCGSLLSRALIDQRSTVWCDVCQHCR